jgi:hypothetical protein
MIYNACRKLIPVIDATHSITCIHQNHDYNHLKYADDKNYTGPESKRNFKFLADTNYLYSIKNANWSIRENKLSPLYEQPIRQSIYLAKRGVIKALSKVK